jgi:class 3 adenylate cyclase/pimeloyl-ACP methyl ester carboxylesterase
MEAVSDVPQTRYTRSADGTILAFQVSGKGSVDLVFLHVAIPIDLLADDHGFIRFRKRLDMFSRTVWFERRGVGASEGDLHDSDTEAVFGADLKAVLEAVGFERPALVAQSSAGGRAIRFVVDHPDRVGALVLVNTYAHYVREDDYPWGHPREDLDRVTDEFKRTWGTGMQLGTLAPSRAAEQGLSVSNARLERLGGGPDHVADMVRLSWEEDSRPLLPAISVPTLVVHREANRFIELGAGRYLADHIPGARLVVLPGDEHPFYWGNTDALADEIEEFLTGARTGPDADLRLAAVLFTDIVASTEHQVRVGQLEWSRLTDHHDAMVRRVLSRHHGREVKTIGDGFLVTFDATRRAVRCAGEIVAAAKGIGLDLRAGVHTGEVEIRGDDIAGITVTIAKRVCDLAQRGQILVTRTVTDHLVGSAINFEAGGDYELKGVPGRWQLFSLAL